MRKRRHYLLPRRHRRYRHNPPSFGGGKSSIGGFFKEGLLGAGAIVVNNLISAQLGGLLGSTTIPGLGSPKGLVKVVIPIVAAVTIGRKKPAIRSAAAVALSVALLEALKPMLPAGIPGLMGDSRSVLPSFSENEQRFDISGYDDSFALPASIAS